MSDFSSTFQTLDEWEKQIGNAVRQLRLDADLDQSSLANRANVSRSAIQNLEAGKGSRLRTVIAVLRALDRLDLFDSLMPFDEPTPLQVLAHTKRDVKKRRRHRHPGGGVDGS